MRYRLEQESFGLLAVKMPFTLPKYPLSLFPHPFSAPVAFSSLTLYRVNDIWKESCLRFMLILICKKNKCKSHFTFAVLQKKTLDLRLWYIQQLNKKCSQSGWIPDKWFFFFVLKVCLAKKKGSNMKYHFTLPQYCFALKRKKLHCTKHAASCASRVLMLEQHTEHHCLFIRILIWGETQFSWCQQAS